MDDENPDREARDRAERIALDEAIGDEAMPCPWWRWQPDTRCEDRDEAVYARDVAALRGTSSA